MLGNALVNALVSAAEEYHTLQLCESTRRFLPEKFAGGGKQNDGCACGRRSAFAPDQRFNCRKDRLGLHHHAFAPAERPVVHCPMTVVRKIAQIVDVRFDQPRLARAAHDAVI